MKLAYSSSTASIRSAIFLTGGLICIGLPFGIVGLGVAGFLLLFLSYWEGGNVRIARAEEEEQEMMEQLRARNWDESESRKQP